MQAAKRARLDRDTIIVSSDFKRARETAQIMASVINTQEEIVYDSKLRERGFGDWELSDHANYHKVWQHDLSNTDTSANNVETVRRTLKRVLEVINKLEADYSSKSILLVGHGDVLQILLAHYHNINPHFHRSLNSIGNAEIHSLAQLELNNRNSV